LFLRGGRGAVLHGLAPRALAVAALTARAPGRPIKPRRDLLYTHLHCWWHRKAVGKRSVSLLYAFRLLTVAATCQQQG
jgi:hypothetical protein